MPTTPSTPSPLSSLVASRRRRRGDADAAPVAAARPATGIVAGLRRTGRGVIEGHVFDAADPERRFVVELVLDGYAATIARAELFDGSLGAAGGDGCHGFCFHLDPAMLPSLRTAAVRIANSGEPVGETLDMTAANEAFAPAQAPQGGVEWTGGLLLRGWLRRDAAPFPAVVEASLDGACVATARADRWRSVARGTVRSAEPGFELVLPAELADGRAKTIAVSCDGKPLPGSPVRLIAFADGLRAHLLERAETEAEADLGQFFDDCFPASVPFGRLAEWQKRFPSAPALLPARGAPLAVVVVGAEGADRTLASPGLDTAGDWVGTMLPAPDDAPRRFGPSDLLAFLAHETSCEVVLFAAAGAEIRAGVPARLAAALAATSGAAVAYCDVLLENADNTLAPLGLPAFDYERSLEQGIGAHCFAMRREAAIAAATGGADDLHRLFLGPIERAGPGGNTHLHLPEFGAGLPQAALGDAGDLRRSARAHLAARGVIADVAERPAATLPALRITRRTAPRRLALVLDAGGDAARVEGALAALQSGRGRKDMRIVVAAPDPGDRLRQEIELSGMTLGETPPGASAARRLALAVEALDADLVCVLDARLRPVTPDWLDELTGRFAEDGVGAVAPVLLGSCGLVAEAGLIVGSTGRPVPAFADRQPGDPGYGDALLVARQALAVGPACFLTRRADFLALGGFDPLLFPDHLGAVDYCLKLRALGRRVVVTPDAVLAFAPGTDGEAPESPMRRAAREREERVLAARWAGVLKSDPFYSPLLARGAPGFAGLAWPPGDRSVRTASVAQPFAVPPGW